MASYLCQRGYRKWRAWVEGLLVRVACLRWWRVSAGDIPAWVTR